VIIIKIYFTQFVGGCFIVWFLLFGKYSAPFCVEIFHLSGRWMKLCWICNNIGKYLSYNGLSFVELFICLMHSWITYMLEHTWWVPFFVSFLLYILHCSCKIYIWFYSPMNMLSMFVFTLITFFIRHLNFFVMWMCMFVHS
jgi:hypothetical protein